MPPVVKKFKEIDCIRTENASCSEAIDCIRTEMPPVVTEIDCICTEMPPAVKKSIVYVPK